MTAETILNRKALRDFRILERYEAGIELKGSAALGKAKTTQAIVEVTTRKGAVFKHHTTAVRGSATNPMSRDDVAAKARGLLTRTLGKSGARRLINAIWTIEEMTDLRQLHSLLRPQ